MKLRTDTIPKGWNGAVLGVYKENADDEGIERDLKSYLAEALFGAHISGFYPTGQPMPEETKTLLERSRLRGRLDNGELIKIDDEELTLLQKCVASHFPEIASVAIIGAIHSSVEAEKMREEAEAESTETGEPAG